MLPSQPVPIEKLIEELLDQSKPFHPKYLNRLSDLDHPDIEKLAEVWPNVSIRRREALLEDLLEIHLVDDLLNFEAVGEVALQDEAPGIRARAINILREYELVNLLPTFLDMAENDPDEEVRASATTALGTYVYMGEVEEISRSKLQKVEDCLLRLISNSDTSLVHRKALEALGYSSREEVISLIEKAYKSGNIEWLTSALIAMGRSVNPHWNKHVLKMLTNTQPLIRAEAASAAGELEISDATPLLLELLEDSDFDVRMAAIWALSQVGGSGVGEALEK
jgi:hypothetical protein